MSTLLKSLLATFNKSKQPKLATPKPPKVAQVKKEAIKPAENPEILKQAESTAKEVLAFAREQADKIRETARVEMQALQNTLKSQEYKLKRAEDTLLAREGDLSKKAGQIDARLARDRTKPKPRWPNSASNRSKNSKKLAD
jgi:cell division septum initiation protein DivIVA